jgi:osmotically-inducible protein OsmY
MSQPTKLLSLSAVAAALLMGLAGCNNRNDDQASAGQRLDEAAARAEQKAEQAGQTIEQKAEQAGQAMQQQTDKMAAAVDDATLTASVKAALIKEPDLKSLGINVDSQNGTVVLKGDVKTLADKARAEQVAGMVAGVSRVDNQLRVTS